jgi:hypothetical protein
MIKTSNMEPCIRVYVLSLPSQPAGEPVIPSPSVNSQRLSTTLLHQLDAEKLGTGPFTSPLRCAALLSILHGLPMLDTVSVVAP